MMVFAKHPERGTRRMGVAYGRLRGLARARARTFEDLAAFTRRTHNLTGAGDPRRVQGMAATASLFTLWSIAPLHGRVLQPDDDQPGAPRGRPAQPRVLGAPVRGATRRRRPTLRLDGKPHVVVGVLDARHRDRDPERDRPVDAARLPSPIPPTARRARSG